MKYDILLLCYVNWCIHIKTISGEFFSCSISTYIDAVYGKFTGIIYRCIIDDEFYHGEAVVWNIRRNRRTLAPGIHNIFVHILRRNEIS